MIGVGNGREEKRECFSQQGQEILFILFIFPTRCGDIQLSNPRRPG